MTSTKRPRGRPELYTPELADEVIERLSAGEPLAQICRSEHIPALRTVNRWTETNPEFLARFARARADGFDQIALQTLNIADETPPTTQNGGTDSGWVQYAKVRIDTRLKLLAKWDPKRYGERLALAGDETAPVRVEQTIDVSRLSTQVLAELIAAKDASDKR